MNRMVLIVDDNAVERVVLNGFLRGEFNVVAAASGEEAITILEKEHKKISAILLDIVMPGIGGYETLKRIKSTTEFMQIPVVIITGLDDEESREKAIAYGADNYITKPYNRMLLLHIVKNAVKLKETAEIANTVWRDKLTGLLNRESFFTEAERMIRRHEQGYYILSCFDVENFKVINDQYGSDNGDEVLRHIANCLSGFVASINGLCCRYMADKFAVLYPAKMKDDASIKENHKLLTSPKNINRRIRIRIGRYAVNDIALDVGTMFDRAAMAEETVKGRFDVYIAEYNEAMRDNLLHEQQIVNIMGAALAAGEFEPWLQPQYNHATGNIIGAEALVRWKRGDMYVSPTDFISAFERNGFIYEMDKYIWEEICKLLRRWIDEGKNPLPISINISRRDLFHQHFVSVLTGIIDKYKLPYDILRLEVTESAFAESTGIIIAKVNELINLGFTVEIDDFGSGYSSLNTLKDVPATILKLDMKFFENTKDNQRGGNIIESVVRMAKWIGMTVIAEGVEEKEQADYLKSIGCYYIQGFYYSKPISVSDYEKLFDASGKERKLSRLETLDNLNNNEFWNPKSMETFIFNSYVGGACIFEFVNEKSELLRMNAQYINEMGGLIPEGTGLKDAGIAKFLDEEEKDKVTKLLHRAIEEKKEQTCDTVLSDNGHTEYIRMTVRLIATAEERYLFYCVIVNMTKRYKAEKSLKEALNQLKFLNDSAHDILAQPDANLAVDDTLKKLLTYFCADRAYVIELYYDTETTDNTYEICADGVESEKALLHNLPFSMSQCWLDKLKKNEIIDIDDVEKLNGEWLEIKKLLEVQNINSLIVVPLWKSGILIGFAGIDNPRKSMKQIDRLKAIADYIAILLIRRDMQEQIEINSQAVITAYKKAESQQIELLDNLPSGAALYEYDGRKLSVIHINKRYWQLVNREIVDYSHNSIMDVVYSKDKSIIEQEIEAAIRQERNISIDVRILCGSNEYKPFHIAANIKKTSDGKYLFFTSYTPITEQLMSIQEMLPIILSTMMSVSDDLSFVKDKGQRYICCSDSVAKAVGLPGARDIIGKSDYDLFDKRTADKHNKCSKQILEQGKALTGVSEVVPLKSGMRTVITSLYPISDIYGETIGIYGVCRDVTAQKEKESQLELLTSSIPGGLASYTIDKNGINLIYFNDGFCKYLGYSREEYAVMAAKDPLVLVCEKDKVKIIDEIYSFRKNLDYGKIKTFVYRCYTKDGSFRWINMKAIVTLISENNYVLNVVQLDVTEQQEEKERLRLAEEEYRIATRHSGHTIGRYDILHKTLTITEDAAIKFSLPECITDVPYGRVKMGKISKTTSEAYIAFYEKIMRGEKECSVTFQKLLSNGWRWINERATTLFDDNDKPVSAIISYIDVTDQQEKEAVYNKWQQSLAERPEDSYTLFRCNLSKGISYDSRVGNLLYYDFKNTKITFDRLTLEYANQCVFADDREKYISFVKSDVMLAEYYRGHRSDTIEYREMNSDGHIRWLRLSIELVEYPNSNDIEAYLMYENIDAVKRTELKTIERAETDPLTGLLNRATFAQNVDKVIQESKTGTYHALFMLDIDGFKRVNDIFGHGAGDQTLIDIAGQLLNVTRRGDFVGRLGGDEFVVFLTDIPGAAIAIKKAKQICEMARKSFSTDVHISVSIGIALYPQNGDSFESLYKKADVTLYYVKGSGKDNFALYHDEHSTEKVIYTEQHEEQSPIVEKKKKSRMLIVDDNKIDSALMNNIFKEDFIIEEAKDGFIAMKKIHHYGSAIAVILLDLNMPIMSGYEVLEKLQQNPETSVIPVIAVSADENIETSLKAIKAGASDFVTKPIDIDILRIRINSAISKAENEKLRAQNSFLSMQSNEINSYRIALERMSTVVMTLDWINSRFTYCPTVSKYLAGRYDGRSLWRIFLLDGVADSDTVQRMQQLVYDIANDRSSMNGSLKLRLKNALGERQTFDLNVYKEVNDYGLAEKIILTFKETEK